MSHTPEPWVAEHYGEHGFVIVPDNMPREECPVIVQRSHWKNAHADGDRIVACVNALAGVEDPAAEIERLRAFVGSEMLRSDFRTAAEMRAEIERLRDELSAANQLIQDELAETFKVFSLLDLNTAADFGEQTAIEVVTEKIRQLRSDRDTLASELRNIVNADPSTWDDPSDFRGWVLSRARDALARAGGGA
jgi:hypothetical protein